MLSMCGWRLMIPTAALFTPYFTAVGIDERTDFIGRSFVPSNNHKNANDSDMQGTNFLPNMLADTPSPEPFSSVFDVERIKEAMEKIVDRMLVACLKGFNSYADIMYKFLISFGPPLVASEPKHFANTVKSPYLHVPVILFTNNNTCLLTLLCYNLTFLFVYVPHVLSRLGRFYCISKLFPLVSGQNNGKFLLFRRFIAIL